MDDDILKRKAEWVISEKMNLKDDDKVKESSMENFPDRYLVQAILTTNHIRQIVTKDKNLAEEIFRQITRRY